jgi:hypothetical protein
MRYAAPIVVFSCLAVTLGAIAWACIPDPPPPPVRIVVPAAPVKSLAWWWMLEANTSHGSYHFTNPNPPPAPAIEYYAGSISPQNFVARFNSPSDYGGQLWGPAVREDEGYHVRHRAFFPEGLTITVDLRGWSLEQVKADLERCEGRAVTVVETPRSSPQT